MIDNSFSLLANSKKYWDTIIGTDSLFRILNHFNDRDRWTLHQLYGKWRSINLKFNCLFSRKHSLFNFKNGKVFQITVQKNFPSFEVNNSEDDHMKSRSSFQKLNFLSYLHWIHNESRIWKFHVVRHCDTNGNPFSSLKIS